MVYFSSGPQRDTVRNKEYLWFFAGAVNFNGDLSGWYVEVYALSMLPMIAPVASNDTPRLLCRNVASATDMGLMFSGAPIMSPLADWYR